MVNWRPDFLCALVVPEIGDPGTGFALGEVDGKRLVVTAGHVVNQSPGDVELWFHGDLYDNGRYREPTMGRGRKAKRRVALVSHDVAILELVEDDHARRTDFPTSWGCLEAKASDAWSCVGFPDFGASDDGGKPSRYLRHAETVRGRVQSAEQRLELKVSGEKGGFGGLSGAAVLINDSLAGVVCHREEESQKLFAIPIQVLLNDRRFPRPWESSIDSQWRAAAIEGIRKHLVESPGLANRLLAGLATWHEAKRREEQGGHVDDTRNAGEGIGSPEDTAATRLAMAKCPEDVLPVLAAFMEALLEKGGSSTEGNGLFEIIKNSGPRSFRTEVAEESMASSTVRIRIQFGFPEAAAVVVAAIDKTAADLQRVSRDNLPVVIRTRTVIPFPRTESGRASPMGVEDRMQEIRREVEARMPKRQGDSYERIVEDTKARIRRGRSIVGGLRWRPSVLVETNEEGTAAGDVGFATALERVLLDLDARLMLADSTANSQSTDRERAVQDFLRAYEEVLSRE